MTTLKRRPDLEMKTLVEQALASQPGLDSAHVGVAVRHGAVMLSGQVDTYPQKLRAERVVLRVRGVYALDDEITVKGAAQFANDLDTARAVSQALASAVNIPEDSVHAVVVDNVVTLTGVVRWGYQRAAAAAAVARIRGVAAVVNRIEVIPGVPSAQTRQAILEAYARSAQLHDRDITVEVEGAVISVHGVVHSFAERREVNTTAWSAPGVMRVNDCLTLSVPGDAALM